jgi:fluoride ion exporter CrcB/FEX
MSSSNASSDDMPRTRTIYTKKSTPLQQQEQEDEYTSSFEPPLIKIIKIMASFIPTSESESSFSSPLTTPTTIDPETGIGQLPHHTRIAEPAVPSDGQPQQQYPPETAAAATTLTTTAKFEENSSLYHSIPQSGNAHDVGLLYGPSNTSATAAVAASTTATVCHVHNDNSAPFSGIFSIDSHTGLVSRGGGGGAAAAATTGTGIGTGTSDDEFPSSSSSSPWWWWQRCGSTFSMWIVQAAYLGVAAMWGTLLRLILAQLFGQACANPGTIGWIADDAALCVTTTMTNGSGSDASSSSSQQQQQQGGIIFADLPANILGCFLMGLLQDGTALDLAIHIPLAMAPISHMIQAYDILHLALKTGFCGSLTTFSGWNSEMVILLVGPETTDRPSQIWKAILGYVIGIETSLGSYVFGRTVAWWLHQWQNPDLALEKEAMKIRKYQHGIAINHNLPTLERRYLHRLFELPTTTTTITSSHSDVITSPLSPAHTLTMDQLMPLMRWRDSTEQARRVESNLSESLIHLETTLIANQQQQQTVTPELQSIASKHGWDIAALEVWLTQRPYYHYYYSNYPRHNDDPTIDHANPTNHLNSVGIPKQMSSTTSLWYSVPVAVLCWLLMNAILVLLMYHWNDAATAYDVTYRTMAYSMLYATPGVLLRWYLSGWNGKLNSFHWKWLPAGTLTANIVGAMVSISMIACEYNYVHANNNNYNNNNNNMMATVGFSWGIATLRAIKIGFSGCLTTVSTFIAEVHKLTQTRQDQGYKYILITLMASCLLAMSLFVIIV